MERIDWKLILEKARCRLLNEISTLGSGGATGIFIAPPFKCPDCNNIGYVYQSGVDKNSAAFGKAVPCKCRKLVLEEKRRLALLDFCGLPVGANELTFETFNLDHAGFNPLELEQARMAALALLTGELKFLTLVGRVNSGKTHLACACCNEYITANRTAKYAFVPNLLDDLRNSYDRDVVIGYPRLMARYCEVDLLVLDDMYRQRPTAWGSEKLVQIIDTRHQNRKTTILTTNKSLEEIRDVDPEQGDAIVSRLKRESWCKVVIIT
jgi:DNA replication protein DnaC